MAVAIAPIVSVSPPRLAHNTAQRIRIGAREFDHRNRRRNGLKGARARANKLIDLLAGGLGTVGFAHGFQGQLNTSGKRCAEGGRVRLLRRTGNTRQGIGDVMPALAVDSA